MPKTNRVSREVPSVLVFIAGEMIRNTSDWKEAGKNGHQ